MKDLHGKVAVVTGAANGIGRAMAAEFRSRGADVALLDLNGPALAACEEFIAHEGAGRMRSLVVDVADEAALGAAAQTVLEEFGRVDIVCANAGVGTGQRALWERSLSEWRWVFDINVFGVIATVQAFIPTMLERGDGHVVITASMQGVTTGRVGPYAASKHAAAAVAETLFADLHRAQSGVKVSCLLPSYTQNSLVEAPEDFVRYREEAGLPARDDIDAVAKKLRELGKPARELGVLVADAIGTDEFWLIPEPDSLIRVEQRAKELIETRRPGIATT